MIKLKGEGIGCVSLKVPDIEEAITELESLGVKMIFKVEVGQVKEAWFEATNTFGVQIELCEYPGDDIVAASSVKQQ
jgi:peroxiredoxin